MKDILSEVITLDLDTESKGYKRCLKILTLLKSWRDQDYSEDYRRDPDYKEYKTVSGGEPGVLDANLLYIPGPKIEVWRLPLWTDKGDYDIRSFWEYHPSFTVDQDISNDLSRGLPCLYFASSRDCLEFIHDHRDMINIFKDTFLPLIKSL